MPTDQLARRIYSRYELELEAQVLARSVAEWERTVPFSVGGGRVAPWPDGSVSVFFEQPERGMRLLLERPSTGGIKVTVFYRITIRSSNYDDSWRCGAWFTLEPVLAHLNVELLLLTYFRWLSSGSWEGWTQLRDHAKENLGMNYLRPLEQEVQASPFVVERRDSDPERRAAQRS